MKKRSINIDDDLWNAIEKDMEGRYETISEWVRDAIREKLGIR